VAEVDFVANRADDRLYIQVCYILTPENTDREFAPLEAISDNYEKLVLSTDTEELKPRINHTFMTSRRSCEPTILHQLLKT